MTQLSSLEAFAESRGFTEGELKEYEIRIVNGEVVIPILGRAGPWYERTYRPGRSPKYLSPKGALPHLYNPLGLGPGSDVVWVAEGEWDTLSLVVSGVPAVGILGTQNFRDEWILLFTNAEVIFAFDPDNAGDDAAEKYGSWVEMKGGTWRRFRVPEPYEDLNDWFSQDYEGFEDAVRNF